MPSRVLPFRQSAGSKPSPRPVRVLIVDDDENMRRFVDAILRAAAFETTLAADGDEALGIAANAPRFDLLVTDEMMPRMAGHQLARYMRKRDRALKVLYLSGFRDHLFAVKGSLWVDEAFLDKPCTPEQLVHAVSMLLAGVAADSGAPSPDNAERV